MNSNQTWWKTLSVSEATCQIRQRALSGGGKIPEAACKQATVLGLGADFSRGVTSKVRIPNRLKLQL